MNVTGGEIFLGTEYPIILLIENGVVEGWYRFTDRELVAGEKFFDFKKERVGRYVLSDGRIIEPVLGYRLVINLSAQEFGDDISHRFLGRLIGWVGGDKKVVAIVRPERLRGVEVILPDLLLKHTYQHWREITANILLESSELLQGVEDRDYHYDSLILNGGLEEGVWAGMAQSDEVYEGNLSGKINQGDESFSNLFRSIGKNYELKYVIKVINPGDQGSIKVIKRNYDYMKNLLSEEVLVEYTQAGDWEEGDVYFTGVDGYMSIGFRADSELAEFLVDSIRVYPVDHNYAF